MEKRTLKQIAEYVKGTVYGDPELQVSGVAIDSRKVQAGDLFVALVGESTDGHRFIQTALNNATSALVEKSWAEQNHQLLPKGRGLVAVDSPLIALQELAKGYREGFKLPVIGVTGSCGKTSTKDMIAVVLGERLSVHKTLGNFNNELGLPLTLLQLKAGHQVAVLEMGMRGQGEIKFLAELAKPEIGVITNIGTTHLELLGSQENIALAKGELMVALPSDGIAVLNGDDVWCRRLGKDLAIRTLYYGIDDASVDLRAYGITPQEGQGTSFMVAYKGMEKEFLLPVPGRHNVSNALAAIGVGLSLGLSLEECSQGLAKLEMTAMRLELCSGPGGITIINDTYNANPTSTQASLEVLAERAQESPKVAVLGSMFELGSSTEAGHKQVGAFAANNCGLSYLLTVGDLGRFIADGALGEGMEKDRVRSFDDTQSAVSYLKAHMPSGAWILVKGSRGMKMERVVEGLLESC
jgi:UDP-N-acetylmuramoyl-tripeptide--D-alanyl-D-alanine ligase